MRLAAAGLLVTMAGSHCLGVVNTRIAWQVSTDNSMWAASTAAAPGQRVFARMMVSYIGTAAPLGLASFVAQPSVSNWYVSGTTDTLLPFVNGGVGGNTSIPIGVVTNPLDPTQFGRLSPWGRTAMSSSTALTGHVHFDGGNYAPAGNWLRIAQAQVTNWVGGPGNTTAGSGVNIAQLSNVGRTASDPAFNPQASDIEVFRFGFVVGDDADRIITVGLAWFTGADAPPPPQVSWWADMNEPTGSIRGDYMLNTASVIVPSPGILLAAATFLLGARRRRDHLNGTATAQTQLFPSAPARACRSGPSVTRPSCARACRGS